MKLSALAAACFTTLALSQGCSQFGGIAVDERGFHSNMPCILSEEMTDNGQFLKLNVKYFGMGDAGWDAWHKVLEEKYPEYSRYEENTAQGRPGCGYVRLEKKKK